MPEELIHRTRTGSGIRSRIVGGFARRCPGVGLRDHVWLLCDEFLDIAVYVLTILVAYFGLELLGEMEHFNSEWGTQCTCLR